MEVEPQYQNDPGTLSLLYVRSSSGSLVPLDTLVKFTRSLGPLQVNHSGQLPSATISFDVAPGVSLGKALAEVHKLAAATLPDSITTNFQGTAQAFESSLAGLGVLLMMTILVIYLVLGVLYESFIHPITILSGLPSAGFGALMTLWLFGMELDLFAFVGVIMLVGLVKKNAIMMIDFALDAQRTEGKSPADAIFEGCIIRFRPIMMTTMAALMGTLPIAIGLGAGGSSRASARSGGRRRPVLLAVPDPLHNTGVLHLHGSIPRALQRMARRPSDCARIQARDRTNRDCANLRTGRRPPRLLETASRAPGRASAAVASAASDLGGTSVRNAGWRFGIGTVRLAAAGRGRVHETAVCFAIGVDRRASSGHPRRIAFSERGHIGEAAPGRGSRRHAFLVSIDECIAAWARCVGG